MCCFGFIWFCLLYLVYTCSALFVGLLWLSFFGNSILMFSILYWYGLVVSYVVYLTSHWPYLLFRSHCLLQCQGLLLKLSHQSFLTISRSPQVYSLEALSYLCHWEAGGGAGWCQVAPKQNWKIICKTQKTALLALCAEKLSHIIPSSNKE